MEPACPQQHGCTDENIDRSFVTIGGNRPDEAATLGGDLPDALKRRKMRMIVVRGMA
jgi:hypothetical protein